jgi:hypothetical protein
MRTQKLYRGFSDNGLLGQYQIESETDMFLPKQASQSAQSTHFGGLTIKQNFSDTISCVLKGGI